MIERCPFLKRLLKSSPGLYRETIRVAAHNVDSFVSEGKREVDPSPRATGRC
jgi:hypothetical protein